MAVRKVAFDETAGTATGFSPDHNSRGPDGSTPGSLYGKVTRRSGAFTIYIYITRLTPSPGQLLVLHPHGCIGAKNRARGSTIADVDIDKSSAMRGGSSVGQAL